MKILVTGGTGVVGAGTVPALWKAGHDIRLLSRHAERDVARFPRSITPFNADLTHPDQVRDAIAGCEAIVHIAGIDEEQPPDVTFESVNVGGTRALLQAAAATEPRPYFIYLSSLGADRGASEYHRSKLRAEREVQHYAGPWLIVRPGAVYGPQDETLSLLLKMIRALPAVPVVNHGDQRFQPLWYEDLGSVLAQAVQRPELGGRILEVAGPDITTTNAVLDVLGGITDRHPTRVPVPAALAGAGTRVAEALGDLADRLAKSAGLGMPLNTAKLQMLLEGNVIADDRANALTEFDVEPTPLRDGLERLSDLLPEQAPGEGVGMVERAVYSAEIVGSRYPAAELLEHVLDRMNDVLPIDFAAEPGAPTQARHEGETLTGAIPGRGHFQVRLIERTERSATFVTIQGHPLAGVLTFAADRETPGVRFVIEVVSQPANVFDWLALRTVGGAMQSQNWRSVVRRVVDASGGTAPAGVQKTTERLSEADLRLFTDRVKDLVDARSRERIEHDAHSS